MQEESESTKAKPIKSSGYGAWVLNIRIRIQNPYGKIAVEKLGFELVRTEPDAVVIEWHPMATNSGDDETVVYTWTHLYKSGGAPQDAWTILWDESSY